MLRVIPQICLQCGESPGNKSVQAEIKTPDYVNGYTIGFGKFTFTFCDIEHFMRWVTGLLITQVGRSNALTKDETNKVLESVTTFSSSEDTFHNVCCEDG